VVSDYHEISYLEVRVAGSCGVGDEQVFDAERLHDPYSDGDKVHRISLIVVEAALHGYDLLSSEFAEYEIALVADGRRDWKPGDLAVRNHGLVDDLVCEPSQPAPQHNPEFRDAPADGGTYMVRGIMDSFESVVHILKSFIDS